MRPVWLAAAVAAAACGAHMPAPPSEGGAAWSELASEHFTLWTDASPARGRALIDEMEAHRRIVVRGMNNATTQIRTYVIAVRDDREARAFLPAMALAVTAFAGNANRQPTMLVDANDEDSHDKVFTHELTHAISQGIVRHQPKWLAEGLATFFESAQSHGGGVQIGLPREDRLATIRKRGLMPTAEMFSCPDYCDLDMYYATAWALFSFLLDEHFDELGRYLQRLDELPREQAGQAWRDVFPALAPGPALDAALHHFIAFGQLRILRFDIPEATTTAAVRALSDAEVVAIRGFARLTYGRDPAGAATDASAAIAKDPTNLLALLVRATIDHGLSVADATAATTAHPDDWRAWWLVVHAKANPAWRDARAKMCAIVARDPTAAADPEDCREAKP